MTRKLALFAFALAALTAVGFGLSTQSASAAGPVAHTGGPYSSWAGHAIQFDASASAGVGLSYFWSFGDGTSSVGVRPVKTYAASNVYTVTLTVQDATGAQSVATTTATISGVRPVAVPAGCSISAYSTVICGTVLNTSLAGCYATLSGWVCPGATVALSPLYASSVYPAGVVVTAPHQRLTSCNNPHLATAPFSNPDWAYTPLCQAVR